MEHASAALFFAPLELERTRQLVRVRMLSAEVWARTAALDHCKSETCPAVVVVVVVVVDVVVVVVVVVVMAVAGVVVVDSSGDAAG